MTPEQLRSELDALFSEATNLMADGERRGASAILSIMRRLQGYLPPKAVTAPTGPVEAPEPAPAPVEPEPAPEPKKRFRKPLGL